MILGRTFFDSTLLNIGVVVLEVLLFLGIYASPSIIIRFGAKQKPMEDQKARWFSYLFAIGFLLLLAILAVTVHISILPIAFVAAWSYISYEILIYDENVPSNFIVKLFAKFHELAVYIIVGVITTAVAWGVFFLLSFVLDSNNPLLLSINTVLNWCAGVLVAYPMNKYWVFHSNAKGKKSFKEFVGFVASRVSTLIIEEVVMILCVNVLRINQYISKYVIASILVIVLNYVFAKVFVFKKKDKEA